jgi:acyl-CoA synthetase (AMP-forming)/AMP-acid ligase II
MDEDLFRRRPLSMVDLLAERAAAIPNNQAFVYIPERDGSRASLTFSALERRACVLAARLMRQTTPGDRAILLFPPGLDFVVAFFGCLAAGVIAVPVMVPRRTAGRDSAAAIMTDCAPRVVLTSTDLLEGRPDLMEKFAATDFSWIVLSAADDAQSPSGLDARAPCLDDVALLQYTSGSTSTPKGVMITHGNIIANLEMIRLRMNNPARATSVGWVPLYHDMGLMMGVMQPLYLGGLSVLLAPAAFMRRPLNWLRTIHEYRAAITSSPNFAFDLCVSRFQPESMRGIDLTCWQLALNGAEPVRADTIERFTRTFAPFGFDAGTMYPGYGLAEATLLVSGGQRRGGPVRRRVSRDAFRTGRIARPRDDADAQCVVSSGQCVPGGRIAVVAPESGRRVPALSVGEVWVSGPHIARGYWHNQDATEATFEGRIAGESGVDWLRTGDLGFQDQDGELYLTGRIKDLIIIRGINHYPQDIERTVQDSHPALRRDGGAAFSVPDETGAERLVIVQEVERTQRTNLDIDVMAGTIREAVTIAHEISALAITLIPPASLPKTTSGKVQRSLTRQLWLERGLDVLGTA